MSGVAILRDPPVIAVKGFFWGDPPPHMFLAFALKLSGLAPGVCSLNPSSTLCVCVCALQLQDSFAC